MVLEEAVSKTPHCEIAVPASTYRKPHRCERIRNLQPVNVNGRWISACRQHAEMAERGRNLEVA